jgi:hypothetical protein
VGPRAGLDDVEKRKFLTLPGPELRPLGRPDRSQSLYRLSYPGSEGTQYVIQMAVNICGLTEKSVKSLSNFSRKEERQIARTCNAMFVTRYSTVSRDGECCTRSPGRLLPYPVNKNNSVVHLSHSHQFLTSLFSLTPYILLEFNLLVYHFYVVSIPSIMQQ